MEIRQQFPFKRCEQCKRIQVDVNTETWFNAWEPVLIEITIGCKNEELCKEIYETLKEEIKREEDEGEHDEDLQEGIRRVQPAEEDTEGPGSSRCKAEAADGPTRAEVPAPGAAQITDYYL